MRQLKLAEAEHQKVFDELYRKALDQQKHLRQLQERARSPEQKTTKAVAQDPDRTYKRLMEWQNKSREKIKRQQDEKREVEQRKTREYEAECTFRP